MPAASNAPRPSGPLRSRGGGTLPAGAGARAGAPGAGPARHLSRARRAGARRRGTGRRRSRAGHAAPAPTAGHRRAAAARQRGPRRRPLPGRRIPAARPRRNLGSECDAGRAPAPARHSARPAATASSRPRRSPCCAWHPRARPPPRPPSERRRRSRRGAEHLSPDSMRFHGGETTMACSAHRFFRSAIMRSASCRLVRVFPLRGLAAGRSLRAEVRVVTTVPDLAALTREVGRDAGHRPFAVPAHPGSPLRRRQTEPGARAEPGRPAAADRPGPGDRLAARPCWWAPATARIQPGSQGLPRLLAVRAQAGRPRPGGRSQPG